MRGYRSHVPPAPGGGLIAAGNRGEGSENLPLCRNRVVRIVFSNAGLSRNASRGASLNKFGVTPTTDNTAMKYRHAALKWGAYTVVPAVLTAGGFAVANDQKETELPPITVSAHGDAEIPYDQTGVSVELLDVKELKEESIYTVSEALTTVPGVYVLPGGGSNQKGNVSQMVIRGMSSDANTSTMIDGMRLCSNGGDTVMTSNIVGRTDLFSVGTFEVLKGSQGAAYGGGAIGGVLFMETPEGEGDPSLSIFNEAGSFDSYTTNATAQGKTEKLAWFLSSTYTRSDNDMQLANGTVSSQRNGFESEIFSEAMRVDLYPSEKQQLTFTFRREDSEFGYDSMDPYWPSYNNYRFRSNLATAKWQAELTEKYKTSLMAGYYSFDSKLAEDYLQDMRNFQMEWRNSYKWNKKHLTTAGLAWNRNDYDCHSGGTADNQYKNLENIYAAFAEHHFSPTEEWNSSLAMRLEHSSVHDQLASLRAATSYCFNEKKTRVYASAGTGYRAPSSFQRSTAVYNSPYGPYVGNPNLDCEESYSFDVGIEHEWTKNHSISLTFFNEHRDNAIASVWDNSTAATTYVNANGHYSIVGTEVALKGKWDNSWKPGYKLAWTYTVPKTADDRQIPSSCRQTWVADIHVSPVEGLTTGFGLSAAVGRSHYATTPYSHLDNYYNLRWYIQYKVNDNLTLHAAVENLTNQKYVTEGHYMDPNYSFISAGTAIHAGCTIKF